MSIDMSPRRVRRDEEDRLLAYQEQLVAGGQARAERDLLIAELLDSHARAADIADILEMTTAGVYEAAKRARAR
jgi:hypothetical protein